MEDAKEQIDDESEGGREGGSRESAIKGGGGSLRRLGGVPGEEAGSATETHGFGEIARGVDAEDEEGGGRTDGVASAPGVMLDVDSRLTGRQGEDEGRRLGTERGLCPSILARLRSDGDVPEYR